MGIALGKGWKLLKESRERIKENNKENVAYFFIKIPNHIENVFIPSHVAEKILSKGDQFGFRLHLETKDKNNRTYSGTFLTGHILTMKTEKNSNKLEK